MGQLCLNNQKLRCRQQVPQQRPLSLKQRNQQQRSLEIHLLQLWSKPIEGLKERKGSSLVAIKKYIATNYKIDPSKHSHFIKKALTSGVEKKTIVQTKGTGASGSFKLAKVEVKKPAKKVVKAKTPKKPASKAKKATKASARRRSQHLRRLLLPRNRQRKLPQRRNKT